ncbi:mitochondrial ribonuclease P protein 1 homolog [Macrobrachium nipponense]|uniref:mitochondrial ribonuclease P protein 1 homolog n=1 Tax=Macrobrachium nipponense TaxID=159736 RepID=UPI0030C895CE
MMVLTNHHRAIGRAVLTVVCSSPYSYRIPSCAARLYSSASLQYSCIWRSHRHSSFRKNYIHSIKQLPLLHQGLHVQCYCTKAKQIDCEPIRIPSADITNGNEMSVSEAHMSASKPVCDVEYTNEAEDESFDRRALIELEVELLRQDAGQVPHTLTPAQWEELLDKPSRSSRQKYLRFLFLNQKKRENEKQKKELKKLEREKERESTHRSSNRYISEDGHIQYGLWCNTMFLRIHDASMNHYHNGRVMSALMYGQPLVIDLGFDDHMTTKERQNCANQLVGAFAFNRTHADPFYLHFCNAERNADTVKRLHRFIPTMYDLDFPLTVTPESYLDCFPKEKLVYLSPHCKEELTEYDHDAVYIIGGIVDLADSEPLSMAKARKEGIRMQKFPLERYLEWGVGGKSLTVNQTVNIMLDLKHTGDWKYALRHIPKRKLKKYEDSQEELKDYIRKQLRKKPRYIPRSNYQVKRFYED